MAAAAGAAAAAVLPMSSADVQLSLTAAEVGAELVGAVTGFEESSSGLQGYTYCDAAYGRMAAGPWDQLWRATG